MYSENARKFSNMKQFSGVAAKITLHFMRTDLIYRLDLSQTEHYNHSYYKESVCI